MKLLTTMNHSTIEWPKMHILQNGFIFLSGNTTPYPYTWDIRSSPTEIYITIGLGISVSENEIYVTVVLGIFVLEHYTWPLPRTDSEGMGGYTPPTSKKTNKNKATFKCMTKMYALECKFNFFNNQFEFILHYR